VRVIGVSPDSSSSHAKFAGKYGLGFTLLADTDKKLTQSYGAWILKKNYGREYMGVERSTFLVNADGKIEKAWRGVRVNGHVDEVLASARD
jgi:peroxiredoxin Q/BCP